MRILFVINELGMMDNAAIAHLSGVARDLGHERYLCVLKRDHIFAMIEDIKPEVIAYSFNSCEAKEIFATHNRIVKHTGIFSIGGGPHPTLYPESLEESGMNAYCVGEGEGAFTDVLNAVQRNLPVDYFANIHTKRRQNPVRPLEKLETLPEPDRDLCLNDKFLHSFPRKTFLTSRGCPFKCSYCFNSALQGMYKGYLWVRRFPVEKVIKEIKDVRSKHALSFVKFDDDNFAVHANPWLEDFCYTYAKEINLPFNCLIRLESASDAMLDLLKSAGCYSITTSIDSANRNVRNDILRRSSGTNEEMVAAMNRIHRHGIHLFVNYITAVPTATEQDELDSIKLDKAGHVTYSNRTALVPFPGTEVWQYCKEHGLYDSHDIPQSLMRPTMLRGFTAREKHIQRNVLLLGAYGHLLPYWLLSLVIKTIPPNRVFGVLYSVLKSWLVGEKIYNNRSSLGEKMKVTVRATKNDLKQLGS